MTIETDIFAFGDWRKVKRIGFNSNGTWLDIKEKWVKSGGAWRQVFTKNFVLNLSISGFDFNLHDAAIANGWDGVTSIDATITVVGNLVASQSHSINWQGYVNANPDLVTGAGGANQVGVSPIPFAKWHYLWLGAYEGRSLVYTNATYPFSTGDIPAGSTITLIVNSGVSIVGAGGAGGYGGIFIQGYNYPTYGSPGEAALNLTYPVTIINNGTIAGGGGGGAGGGGAWTSRNSKLKYYTDDPGSGGGGGAGFGAAGSSDRSGTFLGTAGGLLTGGVAGTLSYQTSPEYAEASVGSAGGGAGQAASDAVNRGSGGSWPTDYHGALQVIKGGAAGAAAKGSGYISWQVYGDVRGALI